MNTIGTNGTKTDQIQNKAIAENFNPLWTWLENDMFFYGGELYIVKESFTGEFDPSKVEHTTISEELKKNEPEPEPYEHFTPPKLYLNQANALDETIVLLFQPQRRLYFVVETTASNCVFTVTGNGETLREETFTAPGRKTFILSNVEPNSVHIKSTSTQTSATYKTAVAVSFTYVV